MTIKTRLTKLEQRSGSKEGLPGVIVYCVVEPGRLNDGYDRVTNEDGHEWHRRDGETSDAFLDRVKDEARRPGEVATLIAYPDLTDEEQA